ncbi:hypothetical protein [Homoserinibacter sp. YIM 151385]|nr:hypothetical protein [Homoserinibacter sp. YIM 151385]WBU36968.1 hypothetical protein OF852_08505 [Homoserinibacter sp. YIM 151385]
MTARVGNITFYAQDPRGLAAFWSEVLGASAPRSGASGGAVAGC